MIASRSNETPLSDHSDEDLVMRYADTGAREIFEELLGRYEAEIYTYLKRFLRDQQQAEDVFQATFLSVHLRISQFEKGKRFRPWLYAIATNKAIDSQRRLKRHRIMSIDAPYADFQDGHETMAALLEAKGLSPSESVERREMSQKVRDLLTQLNGPTQELIQLAVFQGVKYAEIAEKFGIPVGTVKSRVHNAMKRLHELWSRDEGDRAAS